eukprot:246448-Chlamydomonas_euryale.AAC.1
MVGHVLGISVVAGPQGHAHDLHSPPHVHKTTWASPTWLVRKEKRFKGIPARMLSDHSSNKLGIPPVALCRQWPPVALCRQLARPTCRVRIAWHVECCEMTLPGTSSALR